MSVGGRERPLGLFEVLTRNRQSAVELLGRTLRAREQPPRMRTIPPRQQLPITRRLAIRRWRIAHVLIIIIIRIKLVTSERERNASQKLFTSLLKFFNISFCTNLLQEEDSFITSRTEERDKERERENQKALCWCLYCPFVFSHPVFFFLFFLVKGVNTKGKLIGYLFVKKPPEEEEEESEEDKMTTTLMTTTEENNKLTLFDAMCRLPLILLFAHVVGKRMNTSGVKFSNSSAFGGFKAFKMPLVTSYIFVGILSSTSVRLIFI